MESLRRLAFALCICFLLLASVALAAPRGLQEALESIAKAESSKYNCSFSLAYRDAGGSAAAAHGTVDFSSRRQATVDDDYAFGSVTKLLTGASILKLVSEGRLSLDDEVAPLVDSLLARMADADPTQSFRSLADLWGAANVTGTTLRQLLSMTSGVPDFDTATPCSPSQVGCVPADPLRKTLYADPGHGYSPTRLMDEPWVAQRWQGPCTKTFRPGMKPFCYSSTNFMLLGMVLAAHEEDSNWTQFDQAVFLPSVLKGCLAFALQGAPARYTAVHGYDRTSYNMPKTQHNDRDIWRVDGVFSGWTASDIIAPASAIADLTWEVFGPSPSIAPKDYVAQMVPRETDIYGLASHNLGRNTGQTGKYGVAYGHLGATYGYQSVTAYFPELNFVLTVATNIETDHQQQPADAMCLAYNAAAGLLLGRTLHCEYVAGDYYGGDCKCDPIHEAEAQNVVV